MYVDTVLPHTLHSHHPAATDQLPILHPSVSASAVVPDTPAATAQLLSISLPAVATDAFTHTAPTHSATLQLPQPTGQQFAAAPVPVSPCPTGAQLEHRLVTLAREETTLNKVVETVRQSSKSLSLHALMVDSTEVHPTLLIAALAVDRLKKSELRTPVAITLTTAAATDITCRLPQPFTLDCSALPVPSPVKTVSLTNVENVLSADLSGHNVYMHAPSKHMPQLVQHYLTCKHKAKAPMTGVFVVTHDLYKQHQHLFVDMTTLQTYDRHSPVNLRHWDSAQPSIARTQTKLLVLYDGPATPTTSTSVQHGAPNVEDGGIPPSLYNPPPLSSVFTGMISGAKGTIGVDNMCQGYGFIHPAFVDRHGLKTVPVQHLNVQLGDGRTLAKTNLACKVQVKLGSYTAITWLLVMSIPGEFDVLLGDQFLVSHNAYCMPDKKCLIVQQATRKHVIPNNEAVALKKQQNRTPSILLSAMQFRRQIKKGASHTLCFVSIESDNSEATELPVSHDLSQYPPEIAKLITKFPDVFPTHLTVQPLRSDMPQVINTPPTAKPTNMPMFRYNPIEQAEIETQVKDLLEQGLIQPSTSPYGAPVLLVKKKDGTMRMCIDYRALNNITVKNAYPLPRIDDLLDKIQGAKFFSSLDLLSGYHQLALQPTDIPKTAFKTHVGLYEYRVLSFGLTNAPSVFQSVMNKVFSNHPNMLNKFVLVYMDDILILSKTKEEHLQHLQQVFSVLQAEGLSVKLKKCQFFRDELKFLGHIISGDGIKPDPDKVAAVDNWPLPHTQTELKGFLGLTNYFRRFIRNYSSIAAPLTRLTSKAAGKTVILDAEATAAFYRLKELLKSTETLAIPDFTKPFRLVTDASQIGMGGVLTQLGRPVAYESRKFSTAEMNYSTTDRELLAVVHCLKKWKIYMLHNPDNEIVTDHKPNTSVQTKSTEHLSPRQIRWIEFLQQFPCKWIYEQGEGNIADPLSRFNTYLLAILQVDTDTLNPFNEGTLQLPKLLHTIALASTSDPYITEHPELTSEHGVYFSRDRIYVPQHSDLRTQLISLHHDTLHAGHMGKNHTLQALQRWFFWPKMHQDVSTYVRHCHTCQTAKQGKTVRQGLLQPLSIPDRPWWSISVDFVTGLPETKQGYDAILTIVDRLTRLVHLVPTTTTCDAIEFAQHIKQHVISKHGCPADIVTDRGSIFTGKFWTSVCHLLQMHMSMSTAFHPQSDGSTEIVNKLAEQVLRCHCMDAPHTWSENLCMVEFAINNSYHESLKHTPFFLNYGMHPNTPVTVETLKLSKNPVAAKWTQDMLDTLTRAKQNLQLAKDRQKSYADANRTDISFKVHDKVLLSTTNLQPKTGNRKLYPKFLGPFTITQIVNDVAYRLDLPPTMKIHPVFHVSLLRPYHSTGTVHPPPPPLDIDNEAEYEVESILQARTVKSGNRHKEEFLIKWKGYGFEHCTWEPLANLTHCPDVLAAFRRQHAHTSTATTRSKRTRHA